LVYNQTPLEGDCGTIVKKGLRPWEKWRKLRDFLSRGSRSHSTFRPDEMEKKRHQGTEKNTKITTTKKATIENRGKARGISQ